MKTLLNRPSSVIALRDNPRFCCQQMSNMPESGGEKVDPADTFEREHERDGVHELLEKLAAQVSAETGQTVDPDAVTAEMALAQLDSLESGLPDPETAQELAEVAHTPAIARIGTITTTVAQLRNETPKLDEALTSIQASTQEQLGPSSMSTSGIV